MPEKFETEIIEPEERKEINFNPLDEVINEKSYTNANVNTSGIDLNAPIEEPKFTPPPIDTKKTINQQQEQKREPINPEMKNLGKKDTEMAAGHMANLIIQGYEWVTQLGNKNLQISEKKLNKLQAEGEINLNAMIDYDYGKTMRAGEFFKEYNEQVKDLLKVEDSFKEEVKPLLEKVLAKRGVGMTDEQMLMFVVGKHIASNTMIFFQQKSQMNYMIKSIKEATMSQYAQAPPQPQPSKPQPQEYTAQTASSQSQYSEPEEYDMKPIKPDVIVPAPTKRKKGRPRKEI